VTESKIENFLDSYAKYADKTAKSFRSALILGNKLESGVVSIENYMHPEPDLDPTEKNKDVVMKLNIRNTNGFREPYVKKKKGNDNSTRIDIIE